MQKGEETETHEVDQDLEAKTGAERQAESAREGAEAGEGGVAPGTEGLKEQVADALRTVFDPEIPVNIYELGLIYKIEVDADANVHIEMTLTAPGCPVAGSMPGEVEHRVRAVPGVADVTVDLVWDPPWDPSMMSELARLELGLI